MATKDFTSGEEGRQIINFAIPIITGIVFMQLYHYTDSVIVGRFIGKEALAAVGASTPFVFMLVALVIGISMGTTIIISQCFGRKQYEPIKRAADSLYIFLLISAVILTVLGIIFNHDIMRFINLPEEIQPYASEYLNIYLLGLIFLFGFNSLSAILRGVGDSKTPLLFLIVSSVLNIILDLLFVVVFKWGIAGAAWATNIAQASAVIFGIIYVNKHNHLVKLDLRHLSFDKTLFIRSIKLGLPAGMQQLFVSFGMLAIVGLVNGFGTDVIAAYSAASRIETFVCIIPMNLSIALTTFTGQNFSAGKIDRVRKGLHSTIKTSLIASFIILLVLSAFARPLMNMFVPEPSVIEVGCQYLIVLGLSFWLFSIMFCYMGTLRGMGNTIAPMFISLITLWIIRIPVASLLSSHIGELGIWVSSSISWFIGMIAAIIIFYRTTKTSKTLQNSINIPEEIF